MYTDGLSRRMQVTEIFGHTTALVGAFFLACTGLLNVYEIYLNI